MKNTSSEQTNRRAVIYLRVSTNEQNESGLGLDAQERKCRAYCEMNDYDVVGVYIDGGISASTLNRPALDQAIGALQAGSVLVVLKLDRLTRTVADLAPLSNRIEAVKAEWATVQEKFDTSTATGRLMLRMMLELSQWEREVIGERTVAALAEKKARKQRLGATPMGYRTDEVSKQVTIDNNEQQTVSRARELRSNGLTFRAIAKSLEMEGHTTKRGGKWEAATVALLVKERYIEQIAL